MSEYKSEYSRDNFSNYNPKQTTKSSKRANELNEIYEAANTTINSKNGVIYTKKPQQDLNN